MQSGNSTTDDVMCATNVSVKFLEHAETRYLRHPIANVVGSFATVVIAIVSIFGNTAVVIVSFWSESLRDQVGNYLIVYLSTVDIFTGLLVMIPSAIAVASDDWVLGFTACKIHATLQYMFACSSSYNMAIISIDRAIAILQPLKYKMRVTTKVMIKVCCFMFIYSFTIGLLCGVPNFNSYDYQEAVCAMDYTTNDEVFYIFTTGCICCYFTPAFIICICYTLMIYKAKMSEKSVQPLFVRRNNVKEKMQESHMRKTIRSMIVVVVIYYICYTPYALSKQAKVILGKDMPPWFNYMTTIFIFISSAANPFIYAILRKDYRDAFKKLPKMLANMF